MQKTLKRDYYDGMRLRDNYQLFEIICSNSNNNESNNSARAGGH